MTDRNDQEFTNKLTDLLDKSVDEVGEDTRYRLQMARAQVLEQEPRQPWFRRWHTWATATGFASIFAVALVTTQQAPVYESAPMEYLSDQPMQLLEDEAALDLYEEYDFYVWLSQQEIKS